MNCENVVTPTRVQREWHDMEVGMFFHIDIPIYKQGWDFRSWRDLPDPELFQPCDLDTDQWMEAAKAIDAKYAIFVAKHGSGFLQWQSDLYPYGVKQSSWRGGKGDIVADFVASCHKHGIKPGLYATVSANSYVEVDNPGLVNQGKGGDDEKQREYNRFCENMVRELWSRYGNLFEIWFDGGAIPVDHGGPDLLPILQELQPNAVVFQGPPGTQHMIRWVGNERGIAPYPYWSTSDTGTAEDGRTEKSFHGSPDADFWVPGECDVPIRNHEWFWKLDEEHKIYSLDELMEMYYCSVGRNCNLLLNANPGPDGLVPKADFKRYEEFGREIRRCFSSPIASTEGVGSMLELDLKHAQTINHVEIMEDITHGERVLKYVVESLAEDGIWQVLCSGECIGHKRIQQFDTVKTTSIRLRITSEKATPYIRRLAGYFIT